MSRLMSTPVMLVNACKGSSMQQKWGLRAAASATDGSLPRCLLQAAARTASIPRMLSPGQVQGMNGVALEVRAHAFLRKHVESEVMDELGFEHQAAPSRGKGMLQVKLVGLAKGLHHCAQMQPAGCCMRFL